MHKRMLAAIVMGMLVAAVGVALDTAAIERSDALYEDDQPQEALDILEDILGTAANGAEEAEVYWRMSRATLDIGEKMEDRDAAVDDVLPVFEQGELFGVQAVQADASNHLGYYWQSANIGKWGQAKGILNALFKATPMRDLLAEAVTVAPDHPGSWYVLGQLYAEVPGVISFGNDNYAVSLARKSIVLHEAEYASGENDEIEHDYYIQLASHLIQRDWDTRKRDREMSKKDRDYGTADSELERGWYFESQISVPDMDDVEEAEGLLVEMIGLLRAKSDPSDGDRRNLGDAQELLDDL